MANLNTQQKKQKNGIIAMVVMLLFFFVIFYLNSNKSEEVTFGFILGDEWKLMNEWKVESRTGAIIFLVLTLIGILTSIISFNRGKRITLGVYLFGLGSIMAFLCWAAAGKFIPFTGLLQGAIMLSVPLIFGSMAGLLCERSGVINIAIEGQLLFAAFAAAAVASTTQNVFYGLIAAPIAGGLV